ncbi:uncharacterized protein LOC133177142 [Saccostrea echinata]|uniref:uncharacterized protein LOC133177142 n=1 Tax=Saccostrea echinata TaxID=191078 RepID=UPI002A7F94B5|nr:uncharacterized protein LOC133177142 [Saccostrea echinata]
MIKRKLTNILKHTNSNGVNLSDMQWSSQSYTLKNIVDNFKLPLVVKCSDKTPEVELGEFKFDLAEPLLLHSRKWARKIRVSCLEKDALSAQITEIRPHYVIPEEYEGWFQEIKSPTEKLTPDATLESLIESSADQFLSAKSLSCLSLVSDGNGSSTLVRRHVKSGEILTVRGFYEGEGKQKAQIKSKYREIRHDGHTPTNDKFLICADEKDDNVLIDISQTGCFYRIFESEENGRGLLEARDLIDEEDRFPVLIRHVFGDLPLLTSAYSSVMKCGKVVQEESVLAATLNAPSSTLLELQCHSPIRFQICLNDAILKTLENCSEALQMCHSEGDDFLSGIKVACTIQKLSDPMSEQTENKPPLSEKLNNSPSDAFTVTSNDSDELVSAQDSFSDYGEEDANSEFSFAWTPEPLIKNRSNTKEDKNKTKKDEKKPTVPKFFNSSLNSPMSSKESRLNAWNEQPDVV